MKSVTEWSRISNSRELGRSVGAAKREALELVYAVPRTAGRNLAFAAYRAREGSALDDFATWCALAEKHGSDWHKWPESVQHPGAAGVRKFVDWYRAYHPV